MEQQITNILEEARSSIPFEFNKILSISKLGGMSNDNFLIHTDNQSLFIRILKSNISDGEYGGKFEKEISIGNMLQGCNISPKIYFTGVIDEVEVMVEEYLGKTEINYSDNIVADSIKQFQKIDVHKNSFLDSYTIIDFYGYKYDSRIKDDSQLLEYYSLVKKLINDSQHFFESDSYFLCHADLRRDNMIVKNNKCYIIDWEGAVLCDESIDIAGYYVGNIFFQIYLKNSTFNIKDLDKWISYFSKDKQFIRKIYFVSILQFFSDLTWLENYLKLNDDEDLKKLFTHNKEEFMHIYHILLPSIKKISQKI